MTIQSQKVEGNVSYYIKVGALNIWQHQVIYILPLFFLIPMVALLYFTPLYIKNILQLLIGMFFMFLYMEITFTSTQERYTPNKYMTSIVVASYALCNYMKRQSLILSIFIVVGVIVDCAFIFVDSSKMFSMENSTFIMNMYLEVFRYVGTKPLLDMAIMAYLVREIVSDYFVAERISGLKNETPKELTDQAMFKNNQIIGRFGLVAFIFTSISPIFLGFQAIIFVVLIASLTFYSMDVFDIDTKKKQKQEEREKEKFTNLVPVRVV